MPVVMCIINMAPSGNDGNKPCTHADGLDEGIQPRTQGCEECKKEGHTGSHYDFV